MRSVLTVKTVAVGVSLVGVAGYLVYLLFKSDDDDDYSSTVPRAAKHKILEIRVPKEVVRTLIGRNGKNIKQIENQSNTRINFRDIDQESLHRICVVKGSVEGCNIAETLIHEVIANQPVIECLTIDIPQQFVGKIIGRCGEQITEISSMSGAKMNFLDDDRTAPMRKLIIRGTKEQISLAKSYVDDIIEKFNSLQVKLDSSLARREPRLPAKNGESSKTPIDSPRVERISPLPGQPDSQFDVYVSAMVDPSHFWLQIVGPKATELDQLVENMTDYYGKAENREYHVLERVQAGDLVAALFKYDSKWYRAEVLKVTDNESQAELYYVDYGDTDLISIKELYELRTDFLQLHFQAIECYLGRVEPTGESWSEEAVDKFEEWTHVAQWRKLSAKINGYTVREKTRAKREGSPVPGVELFDVNNEQDINIGEELVKGGYAVFKKESDVPSSRATSSSNISVEAT